MPESVVKYWPILCALSPEQQAAVEALRVQVEALRK
jgi:hypothetical protein